MVAKFMSQRVAHTFFEENLKQFIKLQGTTTKSSKKNSREGKKDRDQAFKISVASVREEAYKKWNNCTAFPKVTFQEMKDKHGCCFEDNEDSFFNFPSNPVTDFSLQVAILGPNAGGMLENLFLDPMHNILNMVNFQVLNILRKSVMNQTELVQQC